VLCGKREGDWARMLSDDVLDDEDIPKCSSISSRGMGSNPCTCPSELRATRSVEAAAAGTVAPNPAEKKEKSRR